MQSTGHFARNVRLSDAVEAFKKGLCRENDVLAAYYGDSDVTKVIKAAARKAGQEDQHEDLKQSIAFLLSSKFLGKIEEPKAVYALIRQTAKNMIGDLLRKGKNAELSLDEMADARSGHDNNTMSVDELPETIDEVTGELSTNVAIKIDQGKASTMLMALLSNELTGQQHAAAFCSRVVALYPARKQRTKDVVPALQKLPKEMSNDTSFLVDLRSALGFTVEQLADNLGITHSVLCIYLYTSNKNVPDDVMKKARLLKQNTSSMRFEMIGRLQSVPIDQLVEDWMKRLGVSPDGSSANSIFGTLIGVSRSTVWRWRQMGMNVPMITRIDIETRVSALCANPSSRHV